MRPIRITEMIVSGTSARANLSASLKKRPWHLRLSSSTRKCSVVMPLGPAAAPSLRSPQVFQEDLFTQLKRDLRNVVGDLSGQWFPNLWRSLGMVGQHLQRFIRPWCQFRTLQRLTPTNNSALFARRSKSSPFTRRLLRRPIAACSSQVALAANNSAHWQ